MLKIHYGTQKICRNEIAYHFGITLIAQHFQDSTTLISSFKISVIETKFVEIQQKKKKKNLKDVYFMTLLYLAREDKCLQSETILKREQKGL